VLPRNKGLHGSDMMGSVSKRLRGMRVIWEGLIINTVQNYQFLSRKEHICFTAPIELILLNTWLCSLYNTTDVNNEMLLQALPCHGIWPLTGWITLVYNLSLFLGLHPYCYITLLEIHALFHNWSLRLFLATEFPSFADLRSYRFASLPRPLAWVTFIRT
jgi:hypothetical protein